MNHQLRTWIFYSIPRSPKPLPGIFGIVFVLVLTGGCENADRGGGDAWGLGGDADSGSSDTAPADPCPDSPTARISATAPSAQRSVEAVVDGKLTVQPLAEIALDSTASTAPGSNKIRRVEWEILEKPEMTLATLGEQGIRKRYDTEIVDSSTNTRPDLELTLTGRYRVGLRVWDESGQQSCNTAMLAVEVLPEAELYVDFRYTYDELDYPDIENAFGHTQGWLSFRLKRKVSTSWDDLDNVIPNTRAQKDRQDWGTPGDSSDDPVFRRVRDYSGSNCLVALDDVESETTYAGGYQVYNGWDDRSGALQIRVYVDGRLRKTFENTVAKGMETPRVFEAFRIEKVDREYKIERMFELLENYPEPEP